MEGPPFRFPNGHGSYHYSVAFIAVRADNATSSYTTPNLAVMSGTCLRVGSAQIESQHPCKGLYVTNMCSDPSVGILRWTFPDRDCMLYQRTLLRRRRIFAWGTMTRDVRVKSVTTVMKAPFAIVLIYHVSPTSFLGLTLALLCCYQ